MNNPFLMLKNLPTLMQKFQEFRNTFTGDPKAQVENLLNSGQMSQEQFNELSTLAKQFQTML